MGNDFFAVMTDGSVYHIYTDVTGLELKVLDHKKLTGPCSIMILNKEGVHLEENAISKVFNLTFGVTENQDYPFVGVCKSGIYFFRGEMIETEKDLLANPNKVSISRSPTVAVAGLFLCRLQAFGATRIKPLEPYDKEFIEITIDTQFKISVFPKVVIVA